MIALRGEMGEHFQTLGRRPVFACVRSAQRASPPCARFTLIHWPLIRGRHSRDRLVTLRGGKQLYYSRKTHAGSAMTHMPDWRGSQALYQCATPPLVFAWMYPNTFYTS